MKRFLLAPLLLAAACAHADTTYVRYDFVGTFAAGILPSVSGFFTLAVNSSGTGSLYDAGVTIGGTTFDASNSAGARILPGANQADTVSRAGGVISSDDTYSLLTLMTDDWAVVIIENKPVQSYFFYTVKDWYGLGQSAVYANSLTYTVSTVSAVPEPASAALLLSGLFGVGVFAKRQTARAKAA